MLALGALVATPTAASAADDDPTPTAVIQVGKPGPAISPLLTGVNNDQWFDESHGLWHAETDSPDADAVAKTARAGIGLVRYPGGTPASLFQWKRAIGPTDQRGCQTDARSGDPRDSIYGPDEHLETVDAMGAEASIMVPFPLQTPQDAADWVEYLNAPAGTNPGGGTAWADVRAENGHVAPRPVRYFEVGNEHDRSEQRFWMSSDVSVAMHQYAFGGSQPQEDQRLGRGCDVSNDVVSDGSGGQVLHVPYPPVAPDSQTVRVDGATWTEVGSLATAGPTDRVYVIDDATGEVTFGDGTHGAVPPAGTAVRADYTSGPHAGFVDIYKAMKAVDPDIDVCATWAPITQDSGYGGETLPELLARTGHGDDYDCLAVHPYTNYRRDFGSSVDSAQQLHDWTMIGEAQATRILQHYRDRVDGAGRPDAYVTTSEFGALFFGPHDTRAYRSWNTAMSHATYMASQWTRLADLGVPWAEGNTLISETPTGLRAVLGGEPDFVETSEAVVRRALKPVVQNGGHVVAHHVNDNPLVQADPTSLGSQYEALAVTSVLGDDGHLRVVLVNRNATDAVRTNVATPRSHHASTAEVTEVVGYNDDPNRTSVESHNASSHPDEVTVERRTMRVGKGAVHLTLPAHSVTVLDLTTG
ncbi:hypothetical protein [Phycicoccus flavus]|uniref:hypothetical protein n=1 Tax=Phycicoccus flavus TaxID=2502783 RepID=UPI000FEB9566|nr:hypothetical protein [Phycicoccus flavus]NHA67265.1 hypothetical protein [Phycicoccus flavus]